MHKHLNKFTVEWKKIDFKEKSYEKWLTTNTSTLFNKFLFFLFFLCQKISKKSVDCRTGETTADNS